MAELNLTEKNIIATLTDSELIEALYFYLYSNPNIMSVKDLPERLTECNIIDAMFVHLCRNLRIISFENFTENRILETLTQSDIIEGMRSYFCCKLELKSLPESERYLLPTATLNYSNLIGTITYGDSIHLKYVSIGNYKVSIIYLVGYENYCYETALTNKNTGLVYIEEIDYDDVLRFDSIDEVNAELDRLRQCKRLFQ